MDAGIAANLDAAFAAALLLLPPRFTTQQLLEAVTGLSYTADIRMSFAEDSNKVVLAHCVACSDSWLQWCAARWCNSCRDCTLHSEPAKVAKTN